jgi:putative heme-binding domain-containing protein
LAHCGDSTTVPAIWEAMLAAGPDRLLTHALIHAVHRLADAEALEASLARPQPFIQGAALRLLDQPPRPRGRLDPGAVVARASSSDANLRQIALQILGRHPEWSGQALEQIRGELGAVRVAEERLAGLAELILAFESRADVQDLLGRAAADRRVPNSRRAWALRTIARSHLAPLPTSWTDALARSLRDPDLSIRRAAVDTAAVLQLPQLDEAVLLLADRPGEPADLRIQALRAALPRCRGLSPAAFTFLIGQLGAKNRPLDVLSAGEVAGQARLDDVRRVRVLEAVRGNALITPAMLRAAFANRLGNRAATAWLEYLEAAVRSGWRAPEAELRALLDAMPPAYRERSTALVRLNAEVLRDRRARLAELEPLLTGGDPERGRAVFFGAKAACATCHRIADAGGRIGPDLTRIGAVRSGHDLVESIEWPGLTFAQGYESYRVATADGRVLGGMIVRQDADVLILRDSSGAETRLRRDEIEAVHRSEISLMPEGLGRALSREEFRDLLAFLRSQD